MNRCQHHELEEVLHDLHSPPALPQPQPSRLAHRVGLFVVAFVVSLVALGFCAHAAEPARPHDLWLILKHPRPDEQNIFRLGTAFPDRPACEVIKASMRKVAGTLQCIPVSRF